MFIDVVPAQLDDFWPGVFVLGIGGNPRPPRGATGLVDWRLGGTISAMIKSGQITGAVGEQALVWSRKRASKIYLFGIGKRLPPQAEQTRKIAGQILSSLIKAGEKQAVLIPDPLLIGQGGKGAEGIFLEGLLIARRDNERKADEFRFIVPGGVAEAEEIHEGFRRAILRFGQNAEGVKLAMIQQQFALQA